MFRSQWIPTLSVVAVLGLVACSQNVKRVDAQPESASVDSSVKLASAANASFVTDVQFDRGSASLDGVDRTQLKTLLDRASENGEIDRVEILAWADREYPSADARKLPREARRLADRRSSEVKGYVTSYKGARQVTAPVSTYNMAEQPNVLEKWLNTSDAKMKNALSSAGIPTDSGTPSVTGKASRAVVLVIMR